VLILDEPTRGIDIGAKTEIMEEVIALADEGVAVVFISSELDEVVRLSDRIVVLKDRRKLAELTADDALTSDTIIATIAEEPAARRHRSQLMSHDATSRASALTALIRRPYFWSIIAIALLLAVNTVKDPGYLAISYNESTGNLVGNLIDILRAAAPIAMISV